MKERELPICTKTNRGCFIKPVFEREPERRLELEREVCQPCQRLHENDEAIRKGIKKMRR